MVLFQSSRNGTICTLRILLKTALDFETTTLPLALELEVVDKGGLKTKRRFEFKVTNANEPPKVNTV